MTDEMNDERREEIRERLSEAIANGQVHPALADWVAMTDSDVQGARDNHEALAADVARREREDREAREGTVEDQGAPDDGDKSTPEDRAPDAGDSPSPAKVAAAKSTTTTSKQGGHR